MWCRGPFNSLQRSIILFLSCEARPLRRREETGCLIPGKKPVRAERLHPCTWLGSHRCGVRMRILHMNVPSLLVSTCTSRAHRVSITRHNAELAKSHGSVRSRLRNDTTIVQSVAEVTGRICSTSVFGDSKVGFQASPLVSHGLPLADITIIGFQFFVTHSLPYLTVIHDAFPTLIPSIP